MTWIGETNLAPVEQLLVRLCRRDAAAALGESDLALLAQADFRARFHDLACEHRVAGLVLATLRNHPRWGCLSPTIADELLQPARGGPRLGARTGDAGPRWSGSADRGRSFDELCARADEKDRELERLLGLLRAERAEPLVLKGPALRRTAYRRPVERRYSDFDLLFAADRVDHAIGVIEAAGYAFPFSAEKRRGYRELHFHLLLRRRPSFRAEVHWRLSGERQPFQLDAEAFVDRSVLAQASGAAPFRVPCPEHLLLHMAHENLRDSMSRLSRIVDLDRIVASSPGLDWDYLVAQARGGALETVLALALELSRELLGASIPPEVQASLRPGAMTRLHLGLLRPAPSLLGRSLRDSRSAISLSFWLQRGWRERAQWLRKLASGEQHAEQWIFRAAEEGPPPVGRALGVGVKSVLALARDQASLHLRRLERGARRAR